MNEFLYVLRPARADMLSGGPTEREREVVGEHFRHLRGLCDGGVVVLAGRTTTEDERVFGVCVLRAGGEGEAGGGVFGGGCGGGGGGGGGGGDQGEGPGGGGGGDDGGAVSVSGGDGG